MDRLPYWGHYKSALVMDREWARQVCDAEDRGEEHPPADVGEPERSPLHYDEMVSRLDLIADRVMGVRTAVQHSIDPSKQEPHFQPMERPVTALDKERERRAVSVLTEVERQIFGDGLLLGEIVIE
jgi:hypothetical protein